MEQTGEYIGPQVFRACRKGILILMAGMLLLLIASIVSYKPSLSTWGTAGWPFTAYYVCPCGAGHGHEAPAGLAGDAIFWTAMAAAVYCSAGSLRRSIGEKRKRLEDVHVDRSLIGKGA